MKWMTRIAVLMAVVVLIALPRIYLEVVPFAERRINGLDSIQQAQLDLNHEMSKHLSTLSTLLLGALWALVVSDSNKIILSYADRKKAVAICILASVSV